MVEPVDIYVLRRQYDVQLCFFLQTHACGPMHLFILSLLFLIEDNTCKRRYVSPSNLVRIKNALHIEVQNLFFIFFLKTTTYFQDHEAAKAFPTPLKSRLSSPKAFTL
jgi:hypothetical protein